MAHHILRYERRSARLLAGDVTPEGVLEPHVRDTKIDARIDRLEPGAGEVGLGIGELDAGGAAVLKEGSTDAVRFLGGGEPTSSALDGDLGLTQRVVGLGDLDANP